MAQEERRTEVRIPISDLPECLKIISFKLGFFEEYSAVTINASNFGMCFICKGINKNDINEGQGITIRISPQDYKLKAKVIYVMNNNENELKFGINFNNGYPINKYQELLQEK